MAPFEYLLVLASVILGLAVAELAIGLNRLLRAPGARWDWLAPLAAALAFLKIVTQWWSWHAAAGYAGALTFEMFLAVLVGATLLFLLAAAPLPEPGDEATDLRAHWHQVSPRFWTLFALHWALATATSLWVQVALMHARLSLLSPVFLVLPAAVALIFVRARWAQALGLIGFSLIYLAQYFGHSLS